MLWVLITTKGSVLLHISFCWADASSWRKSPSHFSTRPATTSLRIYDLSSISFTFHFTRDNAFTGSRKRKTYGGGDFETSNFARRRRKGALGRFLRVQNDYGDTTQGDQKVIHQESLRWPKSPNAESLMRVYYSPFRTGAEWSCLRNFETILEQCRMGKHYLGQISG